MTLNSIVKKFRNRSLAFEIAGDLLAKVCVTLFYSPVQGDFIAVAAGYYFGTATYQGKTLILAGRSTSTINAITKVDALFDQMVEAWASTVQTETLEAALEYHQTRAAKNSNPLTVRGYSRRVANGIQNVLCTRWSDNYVEQQKRVA